MSARVALLLLSACLVASPADAEQKKPATQSRSARPTAGPRAIGRFEDWTAAIHPEAGQSVCYAFTRAVASSRPISGRGDVVLTVTERPGGRDTVAISAGFAYSLNAAVSVSIEQTSFEFYTAQRSAFAHDGHAAVMAFQRGRQVVARSPTRKGAPVSDTFSLRGFSAAFSAIQKACPSSQTGRTP